jgi:Flp pilus assembly protein TadG
MSYFRSRPEQRRGSVIIITALMMLVLLGFAALVVDLGNARVIRAQMQSVADAAALGSAPFLDGTDDGITNARQSAVDIATLNQVRTLGYVALDDNTANNANGDVVVGTWDGAAFTATTTATDVNAIQVRVQNDAVGTYFAVGAFGQQTMAVGSGSIAQVQTQTFGAGEVDCYLPLALPDCIFDTYSDEDLEDLTFVLNPAGVDNTGWVSVGTTANANDIKDQLADCTNSGSASVEDDAYLNNGVISSAVTEVVTVLEDSTSSWDTGEYGAQPSQWSSSTLDAADYGNVIEGPVILFDGGEEYCTSGGSWNGSHDITGFAWGVLFDVDNTGSASTKNIRMRISLGEHDMGTDLGGSNVGIVYEHSSSSVVR